MADRKKYKPRGTTPVVAVRLDLDTEGFHYQKWGSEQTCKRGDWIVDNDGEVYTVDADSFQRTYREISRGLYQKETPVWAEVAERDGTIHTKEGDTQYKAGFYLVFNNEDGTDGYAVAPDVFEKRYSPGEE